MLKGWFCGYCFAAISRSPSLTLYIFSFLDLSIYLHPSPPPFLSPFYLFFPLFLPLCFPLSAGHTVRQGQMGQHRFFYSQNPPLSKALFADDWELWSRARNTFQGCRQPCLDWLVLLKHTHRHRQAHNFICLLNLWLRHIKIKAWGWVSFSQTRLRTRLLCLQSWDWQYCEVTLKEWQEV